MDIDHQSLSFHAQKHSVKLLSSVEQSSLSLKPWPLNLIHVVVIYIYSWLTTLLLIEFVS